MSKAQAKAFIAKYKPDPIGFACDVLDVKPEHVWPKMIEVSESVRDHQRTCVFAGHGVSKAVSTETEVLTLSGFKKAECIKQGDSVLSEDGKFVSVTGVSDIKSKPMFRVSFDDNSHIDVDGDHLWNVHTFLQRKRLRRKGIKDYSSAWDSTVPLTTSELNSKLLHNSQVNFSIPLIKPLSGLLALPNAYIVGLWLGDGTRGTGYITIGDKDVKALKPNNAVEVPSQRQENCGCYRIPKLRTQLRLAGILKKKFVPAEWLCELDYKSRIALLQGFMDADGYKLAHGGSAAFGVTDKLLYDGIVALIASLGVKVHTGVEHRVYNDRPLIVYKANFSPNFQPFRLKRKRLTRSTSQQIRRTAKYIVSIEPIADGKVCCLVVDSDRHLFACGRNLTITHNTYNLARIALWFLYTHIPSTVITTAPIFDQVEKLLWKEIHTAHSQAKIPLGGKMTKTQLDVDPDQKWFAYGFSTKADTVTGEATRMQGYHNKHVLIIFDEAAGIPAAIWKASDHLLTDPNCKIITVGNPTSSSGSFAECEDDPTWNFVRISVKDTPNFKTGEQIIPEVSGRAYEEMIRRKYGEESIEYGVRIEGKKPEYTQGTYLGKWLSEIEDRGQVGTVRHEPAAKVFTMWDYGNVYNAIWFVQFVKEQIHLIDFYFDGEGLGLPKYALILKNKDYIYEDNFAPPDLWGSNAKSGQTGKNTVDVARELGIDFRMVPDVSVKDRIEASRGVCYKCWFSEEAREGFVGLKNWRQRKNEALSTPDKPVYFKDAVRDWTCHVGDAFSHMAVVYRYMDIMGKTMGRVTSNLPAGPPSKVYKNKNILTRGMGRTA